MKSFYRSFNRSWSDRR